MRFTAGVVLGWVTLLNACGESADPSPPEFALSPESQWAGGEIEIRSGLFRGRQFIPTITAAGEPMSTRRINDSTIAATLPGILPSGTAAIELIDELDDLREHDLGSVEVVGFRSRTQAAPGVLWEPYIVPSVTGPVAVAGLATPPANGGTGIVDLRTALTVSISGIEPPDVAGGHGVGVTFNPNNFILRDSLGVVGEWQLLPTVAYVDTVPSVAVTRQIARLSDSVWVITGNHSTVVRRASGPDISLQIEDPWRFNLSVAADKALLNSTQHTGGAAVLEMSTGDTLYRLPLIVVSGAAFTPDGATLFVVGNLGSGLDHLFRIDAATGVVQQSLALGFGLTASGVALAETGSRIYVGAIADSLPEVVVFENGTSMTYVGRMSAPLTSGCTLCGQGNLLFQAALAVDDATQTVFLISHGDPAQIWEFDVLPEALTTARRR